MSIDDQLRKSISVSEAAANANSRCIVVAMLKPVYKKRGEITTETETQERLKLQTHKLLRQRLSSSGSRGTYVAMIMINMVTDFTL